MRPDGTLIITGPDTSMKEMDTFTCGHCNTVVLCRTKDPADCGGACRVCWRLICKPCAHKSTIAGKSTCDPFEKKLEAMERTDRFRRELGV